MTQERFVRLQQLFERAVSLTPDERTAWLAGECGTDTDLRGEVEALIAAEASTDQGIGNLIGRAVREALEAGVDISGRRIGPYRIVRTIGQGGMGAVYLAERADDQYRGQVAIKLVNALFSSPLAGERLRAERQILANLDHPNIARLLDGGTTVEGMPYLIMEYIEGVPIDVYCDQRELPLRARLELFRDVCAAVHYAHQHLVVHRDIKPSNILVTADGRVKLLDFGIAKLLDEANRDRARDHTIAEQRMLSPEYASPEHIMGQPITTASDVYSLGVLFYKLLAGRLPYVYGGDSLVELAHLATAQTPELPSTTAQRAVVPPPALVARARRTTPDKLVRALLGDLDNIVMMALRKEPERRYRSASQFGEDIRRHLAGLPVAARRDTWHYRTGKFIRRHPFGVGTAIAGVLLLSGYAVTLVVQNERIRAEQERAEAAAEFLVGLFELFDPRKAQGQAPTVDDILRKGEERVDSDLRAQPELQAVLRDALGRVYYSLGDYEEAQTLLERALAEKRAQFGPLDVRVAQTMSALAVTYFDRERIDDGERMQREALDIVSQRLGAGSLATAKSMTQLGRILRERGQLDDAEKNLRQAITILEQRGPADESLSVAENFLASVLVLRNDLNGAEQLYRRMLARDREVLGEEHPLVLKNLASLAVVLEQRGDFGRARCAYTEALDAMRRVLGNQHPDLTAPLVGLGYVLLQLGDLPGAEAQFSAALEIDRTQRGEHHWRVAYDESNLAGALREGGRLDEAESLYRAAVAGYDRDNAGLLSYVATAQQGLGDVLIDLGRLDEAGAMLTESAATWKRSPSQPTPAAAATARAWQGRLALAAGSYDEAETLLAGALAQLESNLYPGDLRIRRTRSALVELYERTGREDRAAEQRSRIAASEQQVAQLASADCVPGASFR
jgi:serine/threonine-protein kinase